VPVAPYVIVIWNVAQTDSVQLAVDDPDAPVVLGLAPSGELQVPYECPGPHTVYLSATGAGKTVKAQQTR
jgi:hypothetical protein